MSINIEHIASQIKGLTQDSRAVEDGFLFAAFPGEKFDGRDFIERAVEAGASHILAPTGTNAPDGAELIEANNPRLTFAQLACVFYGAQPEIIAAVTGTNGKTSVVSFLDQLWRAAGANSRSLGTLDGKMTTLETTALHKELSHLCAAGTTHLAMEASSHGLDQCRMHGVKVNVAAFTNLSRDHLDYHGDMKSYLEAKAKLFSEVLDAKGTAVLNADIPEFETLKTICEQRGIKVIDYGRSAKYIRLIERSPRARDQVLALGVKDNPCTVDLPLVGEFQAMNALCALGMAIASNEEKTEIYLEALEHIKGAKGRLQIISGHPKGAGIYIDYAHTPDALENVLTALRPHTKGRLTCVFGCGGDRDHGKRPQMGEVASRLADDVIVTDDNPRSEDPAQIRMDILNAAPRATEIAGRAEAITCAIQNLAVGDVLVIAGKGHEQGQIIKDTILPFDDAEEAVKTIKALGKG